MYLHHPARDDLDLPTVLHALSDPQRLRIVGALAERGEPCRCGSFGLDVSKSTLTHHFRVLREAGLITQAVAGTSKLNSLRREDLDERFPGLLDAVLAPAASPV
jgi:DNA-binding transcriptional ArsR family regulator